MGRMDTPYDKEPSMTRTHAVPAALAAAGAAIALAACGGGEDSATGAGDEAKLRDAAVAFARCMRERGVDVPDPGPGSGSIVLGRTEDAGEPGARAAQEECGKHLAAAPPPKLTEEQRGELREAALAHARCMREQGIDFPDPTFGEGGAAQVRLADGFDPGDPRVRRAAEKCNAAGGPLGQGVPAR